MGRGGQQSSSLLYGASTRAQRLPLILRVRRWAEGNPVDYARQVASLDRVNGASDRLVRILEEKAGEEHDSVRDGWAEVIIETVEPTNDGEVAVHYSLSPLAGEELDEDPEHALVLGAEELREEEILELAAPELERRHREGSILLPV